MNGTTAPGNWTGLFRPGEKLRLRFINGSAMTYFDVRVPGVKMTVVAADGQYVHPVSVDEFRIAAAETFDVIVQPTGQDAFTIFAQDSARTGYVRGTLAVREGLSAPVPPLDPRPLLTMADMGMAQGAHHEHEGAADPPQHPASERHNPLVDNQATMPTSRLDDPGNGLRDNGRSVLRYAQLHSLFVDPDGREPARELELHLTGHMEKFAWSFNGIHFADSAPLRLNYGERLRIVLVNDTMMAHPVHLHGMWSDVEDDHGEFMLRKHTVDLPPGSRRSYRVRADALGNWAFHCHLLYHMESGMMRHVLVEEA
jgi:FtsP/CotA-like multicopper oxidase with cupredoxin domain